MNRSVHQMTIRSETVKLNVKDIPILSVEDMKKLDELRYRIIHAWDYFYELFPYERGRYDGKNELYLGHPAYELTTLNLHQIIWHNFKLNYHSMSTCDILDQLQMLGGCPHYHHIGEGRFLANNGSGEASMGVDYNGYSKYESTVYPSLRSAIVCTELDETRDPTLEPDTDIDFSNAPVFTLINNDRGKYGVVYNTQPDTYVHCPEKSLFKHSADALLGLKYSKDQLYFMAKDMKLPATRRTTKNVLCRLIADARHA